MEQSERMRVLIDALTHGNQARFSDEVGIERSMLNKMVKGTHPLTERTIARILSRYPQLDADFLRGLTDEAGGITVRTKSKDDIIREKNEEIAYLRKSIDLLERLVQAIENK